MFLPRALSATTDAQNALIRLKKVFHAPLRDPTPFTINPEQKHALEVAGATFEWEESLGEKESKERKGYPKKKQQVEGRLGSDRNVGTATPPFRVHDITMMIPRGSLVAIVGSVGSGKVKQIFPFECVMYAQYDVLVEPASMYHRRDAKGLGRCLSWRSSSLLSSNSLDPKCDTGMYLICMR